MTLKEKADAFSELLKASAREIGGFWTDESGEGHAEEREDILLEDVAGWLTPIGFPEELRRDDKFFCFAEWREDNGEVVVDFVDYLNGAKQKITKVTRKGFEF